MDTQTELGDDEMLTLIRMAGWDVREMAGGDVVLFDSYGAAFINRRTPDKTALQALFAEFLHLKERLQ